MSENFDFLNTQTENSGDTADSAVPPMGFAPVFDSELYEKYNEKKEIRRLGNASGFSTSVLFVVSFSISFVFSLILVALLGQKGMELLSEPAVLQAIQIAFSLFSFTVPFIIIFKALGYRIDDAVSFKKTPNDIKLPLIFFGLGFCSFARIGSSYMDSIFQSFGIDYGLGEITLPKGVFGFILTTLSMAVVPALVEEFAMRGIVLGSLRKFGDKFALITSSVVFGLMHGNFSQIPFAFVMGLFFGFCVIKTGSLRISILVHFLNNFVSVLFSYVPESMPDGLINVLYIVLLFSCFVMGIIFLKNEDKEESLFSVEDTDCRHTLKEKYKIFFTSAGMVIFTFLSLLQAVIYIFI